MDTIPYGYCHCGCGQRTSIARQSHHFHGWVKGEPMRYVHGHNGAKTPIPSPEQYRLAREAAYPDISYGYCCCGCGEKAPISKTTVISTERMRGEPARFIVGHSRRISQRKPHHGADYLPEDRGFETPCWIWQRYIGPAGYGNIGINQQSLGAHRYFYEMLVGSIPEGMVVHHKCEVRACINPEHLMPVTQGEHRRIHREMLTEG